MLRSNPSQSWSIFRNCHSVLLTIKTWHLPFTVLDPSNMSSAHKMSPELQKRRHVVYVAWTLSCCFFFSEWKLLVNGNLLCLVLYMTEKTKAQLFEAPLFMFKVGIKQLLRFVFCSGRSHVTTWRSSITAELFILLNWTNIRNNMFTFVWYEWCELHLFVFLIDLWVYNYLDFVVSVQIS